MTTRQSLTADAFQVFSDEPQLQRLLMGVSPRGRQFVLNMDDAAGIGPTAEEGKFISAAWIRAQSQLLLYGERKGGGVLVCAGDPWGWLRCYATEGALANEEIRQEHFPFDRCSLPFRLVSPATMSSEELEAVTERWLNIGKTCAHWSSVTVPVDGGDASLPRLE